MASIAASAARTTPVHLVTVLHGLWGAPQHVNYIVESVTRQAAAATRTGKDRGHTPATKVVVLAPSTNAESFAHTYDGIDVCADRVLAEIDAECKRITTEDPSARIAKFSIVGYSLGGLIARFVLGLLDSRQPSFFDQVEPVHFATFASPAIGIPHYETFWSGTFRFLGSRLLSRTGNQLYERDRFLPERFTENGNTPEQDRCKTGLGRYLPRGKEKAEPLLKIMADPRYSFHQALLKFKHVDVFANTVNDRTVPFPTGAFEAHDPFALARAQAKKAADARGDDPDAVPDIREGGLEVHLVRSTPLVESYGPPEKPFVPSPEALAKNKKRRFRLRLPLLLRPTTYPFSRPVSLLVICFLPIALPLSVGFLITRFALQGRESRKRIATARKEKGEGREGMLMRVGVRIGEIAEQVGGDNPEYAADLETSETEEGSYESERDQGTGGDGNGNGNGEASERRVVGTRTPASAASTPRTSSAASSARSSSPLIPVSSASPAPSAGAPATTRGPAPTAATLAEARKLRTDPALSPSQLFQLEHLNAIPQLRKHYVYLPHARNAHGAIVRRDPAIAMHREGKKVVDAWVSGFEV
ncbi:hypothetical protein BMF94_6455 [Rhodotorula taiwanensis]|uniref:DUF676 domain-containing protein n=1 Tax=Rhodotorula taiwanensis TaxID=741276 RepID=A0A2S5B1J2_9BASI|nr:hypothetical protein BMF94_6455 [Rhodotorula taiwanensis]